MIVEAALQEDVDAVGLSILSGAHMALVPTSTWNLLRKQGQENVALFLGGIIPEEDIPALWKWEWLPFMDLALPPRWLLRRSKR